MGSDWQVTLGSRRWIMSSLHDRPQPAPVSEDCRHRALHCIASGTLRISASIAASQGCAHSSLTIRAVLRKRTQFGSTCHHHTADATASRMRHVHVLQVGGQGHLRTIAMQIDVVSAAVMLRRCCKLVNACPRLRAQLICKFARHWREGRSIFQTHSDHDFCVGCAASHVQVIITGEHKCNVT